MITGEDLNADLTAHVIIKADDEEWTTTEFSGVLKKGFELITDPAKARETCLLKFEAGASLPEQVLEERTEIMVIEGACSDGHGTYGQGVYVRNPPGGRVRFSSEGGCVVLMKRRANVISSGDRVVRDTNREEEWEAWGERGSHKVQLYDASEINEASWIGRMLPDMHIPEHDHAGGEEIFVLKGHIEDESGVAGASTWVRFPIGLRHTPFSHADGCMMIVREGDVIP